MTSRIFKSIVTVAAVILCVSLLLIMGVLYGYACDAQTAQLRDELSIAAAGTEQAGLSFLEALDAENYRLTWIQPDGAVKFDTHAQSGQMENHGNPSHYDPHIENFNSYELKFSIEYQY